MKRITKIIATLLAVIMTVSVFCLPVFAEDVQNDPYAALKEGTGYVAIGDSFTRGYGAGENWQNEIYLNDTTGNYNCRNVGGSYPNIIAEAFGLNAPDDIRDTSGKMWSVAHDALSTAYILDLLGIDDGYRDEEFLYARSYMIERYETDLQYYGDPLSYSVDGQSTYGKTGEIMSIREMLKNASLITLEVGQSDIIYKAQIFGLDSLDTSSVSNIASGVGNIIDMLFNYYKYWKGAFPLLLDFIKENNPDANVVLVGTMNPIRNATLSDDVAIRIGSVINIIFDLINGYTKRCAMKYGYTYVDITNVESPSVAKTMSIGEILSMTDETEFALQAHPTANGYRQIAKKIINAVNANLEVNALKDNFTMDAFFKAYIDLFKAFISNYLGL